jgi:hypothetical protein
MLGEAVARIRTLLGLGDRRTRAKLGLGDRRDPKKSEEQALTELERLAWIKWKGEHDSEANKES